MQNLLALLRKPSLQKYLANTSWQVGDKVIRMLVSLLVSIVVNRYLGPENYGIISYITSYLALYFTLSNLGLDEIIVREIINHPDQKSKLLGSAFVLKLIANVFVTIFVTISMLFVKNSFQTNIFIIITAVSYIFQTFTVIDYYFQSIVKSQFTIKASLISLTISSVARLLFVYYKLPIIFFVLQGCFDVIVTIIGLLYFYKKCGYSIFNWRIDWSVAKSLLSTSWPLIFAGMIVTVYMRIDQVMIKEMMGFKDVGIYSAAVRISELWYFIPMSLGVSLFPAILNAKKISETLYYERLQLFFNLMSLIAIIISIPITLFSEEIILLLYGVNFVGATLPLQIHIWTSIFVFLGVASSKWFIAEGYTKLQMLRTVYGAIFNIGLNFILIPMFGISGAAMSTLFAQFFVSYFSDLLTNKTRPLFYMKCRSLNLIYSLNSLKKISNVI